jgi:hypothetical protein
MDARGYNALLNTFMYGYGTALSRMLDMKLVNRQVGEALLTTDYGRKFLGSMGFKPPAGGDAKSITEDYAQQFKKIGITNTFDVLEANDDKLVMDIGMCVFASATSAFRAQGVTIPPCPVVGLLLSIISKELNKHGIMTDCEYKPESNSSIFTVELRDK